MFKLERVIKRKDGYIFRSYKSIRNGKIKLEIGVETSSSKNNPLMTVEVSVHVSKTGKTSWNKNSGHHLLFDVEKKTSTPLDPIDLGNGKNLTIRMKAGRAYDTELLSPYFILRIIGPGKKWEKIDNFYVNQ